MAISPLAGKPAPKEMLLDPARLEREYFEHSPDLGDPNQLVSFGTSGHRGTPLHGTFTEAHILAITQAICDYRRGLGKNGPLYMGKDTHAMSSPAQRTALEVLAANGVETMIDAHGGYTPTPVISHAILGYNLGRTTRLADGIVISPSHNPPDADPASDEVRNPPHEPEARQVHAHPSRWRRLAAPLRSPEAGVSRRLRAGPCRRAVRPMVT